MISNRNKITPAKRRRLSESEKPTGDAGKIGFPKAWIEQHPTDQLFGVLRKAFELKFDRICLWNRVNGKDSFWLDFNCRSAEHFLATLGLSYGSTLACQEKLVELFERETFVLMGDRVLGEMLRKVCIRETDCDARKAAYQAIFDGYCKHRTAFDTRSFAKHVNTFIAATYKTKTAAIV